MTNSKGNPQVNQSLSLQLKSIVNKYSLAAQGKLDQLKVALNEGLEVGITVNEVKDVMVHFYAYGGFPRSLQSIRKRK